jgi:multisubunit Na+/H+ antiporter MnhB subunit
MKGAAIKALTMLAMFALLLFTVSALHHFGRPGSAAMDDYFLSNGQAETGANSIVAAILFDYRGLDTLGEASVLFAAASGIFFLFRRAGKDE